MTGSRLSALGVWRVHRAGRVRAADVSAVPEASGSADTAHAGRQTQSRRARAEAPRRQARFQRDLECGRRPVSHQHRAARRLRRPVHTGGRRAVQGATGDGRPRSTRGPLSPAHDSDRDDGAELSVEGRADTEPHGRALRELHAVAPDLHRRTRLPRRARADLVRLLARQVGRRHLRRQRARLQRQRPGSTTAAIRAASRCT